MSLSALSGNGSFTSYGSFFRAKCDSDYELLAELVDSARSISGLDFAEDEWEAGHRLTAVAILAANVAMVLLACRMLVAFVRQGYCYRACSPSSHEERRGLKGEEEEAASKGERGAKPMRAMELEEN